MEKKPKRLAYLAGLIDGDGSISIRSDPKAGYRLTVSVYNTHRPLMNFLVQQFGGSFRKLISEGNRKQRYQWYTNSKYIMPQVVPYLILKKEQGISATQFLDIQGIDTEKREACMLAIQNVNSHFIPVSKKYKIRTLITTDKKDLAYLGGLMDAEGSFSLHSKKFLNGKYSSVIRFSNTDQRVFDWVSDRFFGCMMITPRKDYRSEGVWYFSASKGKGGRKLRERFLLALLPYLVVKHERAVLILDWIRNNDKMTDSQKYEIFNKISALNARGKSVETICQT